MKFGVDPHGQWSFDRSVVCLGHHPYRAPGDRRIDGADWATL
jgi:hypothetical protein